MQNQFHFLLFVTIGNIVFTVAVINLLSGDRYKTLYQEGEEEVKMQILF